MIKSVRIHPADFQGAARLAVDATTGVTDLVEAVHHAITSPPGLARKKQRGRTRGITGLVYKSIRGITYLVGGGMELAFQQVGPLLGQPVPPPESLEAEERRQAILAALNGVLGNHLAESGNPLAISMTLRSGGQELALERQSLTAAFPQPGAKLLVLVHGLCMNDLQWNRAGHDHGAALERDLGYTPVYLHYNTGLHISTNGRAFARLLETLVEQWPQPVEEIVILAHSMGGLVARSACHYAREAGYAWPHQLRKLIFLGTPHHGSPLERSGNLADVLLAAAPYAAPFSRLGQMRSAGITDLRYGSLLDEDWQGRERFAYAPDRRRIVPLPEGVRSYAIAATLGKHPRDLKGRLLGDRLVPVDSALGRHVDPDRCLAFPKAHQWVAYGMNHTDLLARSEVYERIQLAAAA